MTQDMVENWKPVIRAVIENASVDVAVETIWLLMEPRVKVDNAAAPPLPTQAARSAHNPRHRHASRPHTPLRSAPNLRVISSTSPTDDGEMLDPFQYFPIQRAIEFTGLARSTIYSILRKDPERLPHKHEVGGERQRERVLFLGRGLNAERYRQRKQMVTSTEGVGDTSRPEDPDDPLERIT